MIQKLISALLYAGVDQSSYEMVKPRIKNANRTMTIVLSSFATILILAMLLSSLKSPSVDQNKVVYELGFITSIFILIISTTITKKHSWTTTPLVFFSISIYYLYGIMIGAVTDPTGKTVTFMVMLAFLPTLFIVRPIHSMIATIFFVVLFAILCLANKSGEVLSVDLMDAVIYGLLGLASGTVINHMKVRGYVSEYKLHTISRTDQLTGIQNQNAFKMDLVTISNEFRQSLACVYADANGLHDLNNDKGHEAGDKMLQCIAGAFRRAFGEHLVYRVGGDEFIAFVPDVEQKQLSAKIVSIKREVESKGYSIAVGYEVVHHHHFNAIDFVNSADIRMQEDKKHYHSRD